MNRVERVEPGDALDRVPSGPDAFESFVRDAEPMLRVALVSQFGADRGRDAAAEALRYGWEHWERVRRLDNRVGYLFRVGQRWSRRQRIRSMRRVGLTSGATPSAEYEPGLGAALSALSVRQRQAVVLCVGYGLTHAEVAELLEIARSSVQNHVERGLRRLRRELGAEQ